MTKAYASLASNTIQHNSNINRRKNSNGNRNPRLQIKKGVNFVGRRIQTRDASDVRKFKNAQMTRKTNLKISIRLEICTFVYYSCYAPLLMDIGLPFQVGLPFEE